MRSEVVRFIEALESAKEGSAVKFFNNCMHPDHTLRSVSEHTPHGVVVRDGFVWDETPEGAGYWFSVFLRIKDSCHG